MIGEMFLEGKALFDLSQLLAYRQGKFDPRPSLEKVSHAPEGGFCSQAIVNNFRGTHSVLLLPFLLQVTAGNIANLLSESVHSDITSIDSV